MEEKSEITKREIGGREIYIIYIRDKESVRKKQKSMKILL